MNASENKSPKGIKRALKTVFKIFSMPYRAMRVVIKKRKEKRALKKETSLSTIEPVKEVPIPVKSVTFSNIVSIHEYTTRIKRKTPFSLKPITDSFPPASMEIAERLKGSSKETPLARKILSRIPVKKSSVDKAREILIPREKHRIQFKERNKSRILSILDGYSDGSMTDPNISSYTAKDPSEEYSENSSEQSYTTHQKSSSSTEEYSSIEHTPQRYSNESISNTNTKSCTSCASSKLSKTTSKSSNTSSKSFKSSKPGKEDKEGKEGKERSSARKTKKSKGKESSSQTRSRLPFDIDSDEEMSSVSTRIYNILRKHTPRTSS
ncbi:hypothetical protein NEOKW01_1250 [Nematocida sp. AWRm80]|nr:hypothetical protein NEOKW01_1250 [Nematocida sp. AWRm80]